MEASFSFLSTVTEFISDSLFGLLMLALGAFMLFSPYEKVHEAFPKLPSKKVCKMVGVFFVILGLAMIILLSTSLL